MLRLQDPNVEGQWFDFWVHGEKIKLKIRPSSGLIYDEIRKKYRKVKKERDPISRQMVTTETYDDDAVNLDLIDHVLENFEGFGDADGKALTPSKENKRNIMGIPPVADEQSVAEFVYEKARELAVKRADDSIKNS